MPNPKGGKKVVGSFSNSVPLALDGVEGLKKNHRKFLRMLLDDEDGRPIPEIRKQCRISRYDMEMILQNEETRKYIEKSLLTRLAMIGLPRLMLFAVEQVEVKKSK